MPGNILIQNGILCNTAVKRYITGGERICCVADKERAATVDVAEYAVNAVVAAKPAETSGSF